MRMRSGSRARFRWTLVGLKLSVPNAIVVEMNPFQMDPRGVEANSTAWVMTSSSSFQMDPRGVEANDDDVDNGVLTTFQMDPRGVEAPYGRGTEVVDIAVSDGPSWG